MTIPRRLRIAGCIIPDGNGRILLVHRNVPGKEQWELPGGKIEAGETPEETAIRELQEELGVQIRIIKQAGTTFFREDDMEIDYFWFLSGIRKGNPALQEASFDQIGYFATGELAAASMRLSPNVRNLLRAFPAGFPPSSA